MKNKKFDYKEFQEFIKTPKGKAVLFFGIYAFFFLMIAILAAIIGLIIFVPKGIEFIRGLF